MLPYAVTHPNGIYIRPSYGRRDGHKKIGRALRKMLHANTLLGERTACQEPWTYSPIPLGPRVSAIGPIISISLDTVSFTGQHTTVTFRSLGAIVMWVRWIQALVIVSWGEWYPRDWHPALPKQRAAVTAFA